jgi:hypothetical protein
MHPEFLDGKDRPDQREQKDYAYPEPGSLSSPIGSCSASAVGTETAVAGDVVSAVSANHTPEFCRAPQIEAFNFDREIACRSN